VFYFEQLFQTALNGIDSANIMTTVLEVAGIILILSFLFSAYQAFTAGGDVRMLAVSGVKYLILGLVFANYSTVFRDVNSMFNSLAGFIYNSTGVGDLFATWMGQLAQYWQANGNFSMWNLVTGLASGVISLLLILSAFVIFPVCYLIFTVFYAMYGSVLYVTGPFVLALLPTRGLGQLSRTYLVNLVTFEAWGLIYAILQVLMSAVNLSSLNAVLNANGVLNSFVGSSQMMLLALTAILFSFSIALIPFIASRIVRGDVGSTMMTFVGTMTMTAAAMASLAAASVIGAGEGAAAGAGGGAVPAGAGASSIATSSPPPPPPPSGGVGATGSEAAGATGASSTAPVPLAGGSGPAPGSAPTGVGGGGGAGGSVADSAPTAPSSSPWRSGTRPGAYRGTNLAHAMAWYTGYSVGSAYKALRGRE
jgi:hypothetical protein